MWATNSRSLTERLIFVVLLLPSGAALAQDYPYWFFNQASVRCKRVAVGYAKSSFYPDSAAARAIRNGYENYARQRCTEVGGGQTFWNTEMGMFWMESNFVEKFDSTVIASAASVLTPKDTLVTDEFICVLLGGSGCIVDPWYRDEQSPKDLPSPAWIEEIPEDSNYCYGIGVAPQYFYETSSWAEAEKLARRNLARAVYTQLQAIQKLGYQGQEILHERTAVVLKNVEIVSRWRDLEQEIFYVLVRMPKP